MKKELLNLIGPIIVCFGFLLVLGAAGASDCGIYTTGQTLCQVGIGLAVIAVGALVSRLISNATNYEEGNHE